MAASLRWPYGEVQPDIDYNAILEELFGLNKEPTPSVEPNKTHSSSMLDAFWAPPPSEKDQVEVQAKHESVSPNVSEDEDEGEGVSESDADDEGADQRPVVQGRRLRYTTLEQACAGVARVTITAENDDWAQVQQDPLPYVVRIMKAFFKDYMRTPPGPCKSIAEWLRYQDKNVPTILKKVRNRGELELAAWMLLRAVLEAHRLGPRAIKEHRVDATLTCSARLEAIVELLEKYTICRFDVVRQVGNEALVANPHHQLRRKLSNFANNVAKREHIAVGKPIVKKRAATLATANEGEGEI